MKIFLAGTNGEINNSDIIKKSPYLLESFYYIKPWQYELIHSSKMFMLDSGAFTFFSKAGHGFDWDSYLIQYAEFINEYNVEHFFELDIDDVVGYAKVLEMREKLEAITQKKCIPVWHINRGINDFKKMCDNYDYVAIGGLVGVEKNSERQKILENNFPSFIKMAHDRKAKIHALGYTKTSKLTEYHFDSVDSTRWNCSRFGRLEYFDGKTIKPIDKRKYGKKLKGGESKTDIMNFTFNEWIKFQKYADANL